MKNTAIIRSLAAGIIALTVLLGLYFGILALVSDWTFTLEQFVTYWYFVVALAAGFGIQIGLYFHLRQLMQHCGGAGSVVAVSGGTSTAAMISCCTHYLANILPVLGATGLVALVAQYQVELFWVGLAFNLAGMTYIGRKVWHASRHMKQMEQHA